MIRVGVSALERPERVEPFRGQSSSERLIRPSFRRISRVCRPIAIDLGVALAKDHLFRKRRTEHQNDTGNCVPRPRRTAYVSIGNVMSR